LCFVGASRFLSTNGTAEKLLPPTPSTDPEHRRRRNGPYVIRSLLKHHWSGKCRCARAFWPPAGETKNTSSHDKQTQSDINRGHRASAFGCWRSCSRTRISNFFSSTVDLSFMKFSKKHEKSGLPRKAPTQSEEQQRGGTCEPRPCQPARNDCLPTPHLPRDCTYQPAASFLCKLKCSSSGPQDVRAVKKKQSFV